MIHLNECMDWTSKDSRKTGKLSPLLESVHFHLSGMMEAAVL